jgi:UDP-2-acetamido-3-amino-2,3-dideoxy-glucuronate N-acetyltransferase
MVFTNVTFPRSHVVRKGEYERTLCKQGATIGANATVLCGVTLGRFSFVGAGAVVTKDVRDHALVLGNPARQAGWMCQCGERLRLASGAGRCGRCGTAYVERGGELVRQ